MQESAIVVGQKSQNRPGTDAQRSASWNPTISTESAKSRLSLQCLKRIDSPFDTVTITRVQALFAPIPASPSMLTGILCSQGQLSKHVEQR